MTTHTKKRGSARAISSAADKVSAALRAAVEEPGGTNNRAAAEAIIRLRSLFDYEGRTDWAGRSGPYRDLIERLYREAGVPSDSESNMQANLRYHLGNLLRQTAPPEDLQALGMSTEGPLGRERVARKQRPRKTGERITPAALSDPTTLAALALNALRTLSQVEVTNGSRAALVRTLNQVAGETEFLLQRAKGTK